MAKKTSKSKSQSETAILPVTRSAKAVDQLLSGKVTKSSGPKKTEKEKKKSIEPLPKDLNGYADVLVAGRKIAHEIDFKVSYATDKIKDYCLKRLAEIFAQTGRLPKSATYSSKNSVFTFIQTKRTTVTSDKVDALRRLKISMDNYTELKGLKINYAAIRKYKLENKLRDALAQMGVKDEIVHECFQPDVVIKDGFYDHLALIIRESAKSEEHLAEKIYQVMKILDPTEQIRNADSPDLSDEHSYRLIHSQSIRVPKDIDVLDDDS